MKKICKNCQEFDNYNQVDIKINGRIKKTCGVDGKLHDEYAPCTNDFQFKLKKDETTK